MPDLRFAIEGATVLPHAAAPTLAFALRVANARAGEAIHSGLLRVQLRIEARARTYDEGERARLADVFGAPGDQARAPRWLQWAQVSVALPSFTGGATVEVQVPCTFDFTHAATKYFDALEGGDVPIAMAFSGTVFHEGDEGALRVAQVPWDREARSLLPLRVWKEMMAAHYPGVAVLALPKDTFDRLHAWKRARGLATWEQALDRLLADAEGT